MQERQLIRFVGGPRDGLLDGRPTCKVGDILHLSDWDSCSTCDEEVDSPRVYARSVYKVESAGLICIARFVEMGR